MVCADDLARHRMFVVTDAKLVSISRQYTAVEAARAVLSGGKSKPRPSELQLILSGLDAAANTLRWTEANRDRIKAAGGQA